METKKVYIYRFTTIPEYVKQYKGNIAMIETNGVIGSGDYVNIEEYYVWKPNFDNLDNIIDESYGDGICYDFYSFRNDRLQDFKKAINEILQNQINNDKKEIEELESLQENLLTQDVFEDKFIEDRGE